MPSLWKMAKSESEVVCLDKFPGHQFHLDSFFGTSTAFFEQSAHIEDLLVCFEIRTEELSIRRAHA